MEEREKQPMLYQIFTKFPFYNIDALKDAWKANFTIMGVPPNWTMKDSGESESISFQDTFYTKEVKAIPYPMFKLDNPLGFIA